MTDKDLCENCAFKNRCEKYMKCLVLQEKLEISVKALDKIVNYNSVAEQVDKYHHIVIDVREIGKEAIAKVKELDE